jgi:hypothetical protein
VSQALKRLTKAGAASYAELIDGVATTTINITKEARDSVVDVVQHVAGPWCICALLTDQVTMWAKLRRIHLKWELIY